MSDQSLRYAMSELLTDHGVDFATWGTGKAKTFDHLLGELEAGECVMNPHGKYGIVRSVTVANVDVFYKDGDRTLHLVETRQVFSGGRVRERNFGSSVKEKIDLGEDVLEAAHRAVQEELGLEGDLSVVSRGQEEVVEESSSYPGLYTSYRIFTHELWLSDTQFKREGYVEVQKDKSTYFEWQVVE